LGVADLIRDFFRRLKTAAPFDNRASKNLQCFIPGKAEEIKYPPWYKSGLNQVSS
jgi:hypothetical protein